MALDLSALTNYVEENAQQLTAAAIFSAKTASLIEAKGNVQVGIKSAETINVLTTDAVFQAGGTCGFNSSGTTSITQRQITVGKIKVQEAICPKTFEAKYTQKALRVGSTYDYMAYATDFTNQKIQRIGAALETAIWQGDTTSGSAQLNKFNGFEAIYFFVIDERKPDIFKIGRTIDIVKRLRNYNVGRIKEVDLKYYALVKNNLLIEKCMKVKLNKNQIIKNKEIYQVEPKVIKKIIDDCYCKYVSQKENEDLYKEIGDLLGLYSYTKDKKNIKPYIIIGKDLN